MINVKPSEGLRIRDPQRGDQIPPTGRLVEQNHYWLSAIRDGDVIVIPDDETVVTKTKKTMPRSVPKVNEVSLELTSQSLVQKQEETNSEVASNGSIDSI